ncbi:MAG: methyltransferase [Thermoplasmata archaeon]|nr:methyltransferase [Thermoplasmata archaeon]
MRPETDEPPGGEHYFTEAPRSRSSRRELRFLYRGELLAFITDRSIFAATGLDPGTALLIEALNVEGARRILDLGCGWGAVGVAAAKSAPKGFVVMVDVNRRAVRVAKENVERNRVRNAEVRCGAGFRTVADETFDVIASNPPYRIGREAILQLLTEVPQYLAPGGRFCMVGKSSQGIRFYQSWLEEHWAASVEVLARGSGYRVLEARPGPKPSAP